MIVACRRRSTGVLRELLWGLLSVRLGGRAIVVGFVFVIIVGAVTHFVRIDLPIALQLSQRRKINE